MDCIIHLRKKVSIIRLWHYNLLHFLPDSQLIAQKRECDLIWKDIAAGKQTNHILINYIWEYHLKDLASYYFLLESEFIKRGFKFKDKCILKTYTLTLTPFANHHNDRYLLQCFYNLQEKFDRGQKDFDIKKYINLLEVKNKCDTH